jgi:hypothetical protein
VRLLGPVAAVSEPMGSISAMRPLRNGRVLVNDPIRRQLLLLDSMMRRISTIADSTPATRFAYGRMSGGLLPYFGDSVLFVDQATLSALVITPLGDVARVGAAPQPRDMPYLIGGRAGRPGLDAGGRLVYQVSKVFSRPLKARDRGIALTRNDSGFLVRLNLRTRAIDTVAALKLAIPRAIGVRHPRQQALIMRAVTDPLPVVDDWAVLSNGVIAILRSNYHVDFIDSNGRRVSGPRIPFKWQRLSDSAKRAVVDSAKHAAFRSATGSGKPGDPASSNSDAPFVEPMELPDYRPAFASGGVLADTESRLWIRTIAPPTPDSRPVYDVVNQNGMLIEKVAIPAGSTVVGFAPGNSVYLGVRDAFGVRLVRARTK